MTTREQFNAQNNLDPEKGFSRNQKTAAIFLAVFALGVVVVGIIQISSQIRAPFRLPDTSGQNALAELDLTLLDSDGDGLSDYDELYTYKTSPYLEDTDSDGLSDYEEVQQGTDPLCPVGKNCYAPEFTTENEGTIGQGEIDYLMTPETGATNEAATVDFSAVTPDMLREILLDSGYEADTLSQISDDDLMASYEEALRLKGETELSNTPTE